MKKQRLFWAVVVVMGLLVGSGVATALEPDTEIAPQSAGVQPVAAVPGTQPDEPRLTDTVDPAARVLDDALQLQAVIWDKAKASAREFVDNAGARIAKPDDQISEDDFNIALKMLVSADDELAKNEKWAPPQELAAVRAEIHGKRMLVLNKQQEVQYQRVIIDKERAAREHEEQVRRMEAQRRDRIDNLMNQVMRARTENDTETQMRLLEQVLLIDTNHRIAGIMLDDAKINHNLRTRRHIEAMRDDHSRNLMNNIRETLVPYDDPITYPTPREWNELTERRREIAATSPPDSPANLRVREQIEKTVPEIRFTGIPFERALDFLRDLQRVNMIPHWAAMEAIGITKDTQITLQLRDVTFETALRELLTKAAGRENVLDYVIRDGVIKVSTVDDLATLQYILVYDVRDLLHPLTDFRAPTNLRGPDRGDDATGTSTSSGGGGGIFDDDDSDVNQAQSESDRKRQEFMNLVRAAVVPDSWMTSDAKIEGTDDGLIIVKQTSRGHRELVRLLTQLREHSRIQVTIEVRFLTIESQFLEDIGVDLDIIFNTKGGRMSPIPVDVGLFDGGTGTFDRSTGRFIDPVTGLSTHQPVGSPDIFSLARPALAIAGSFMDDIQVDFFLRATQAHRESTRVDAMRVTLLNGHEAYVVGATVTDYVTDVRPATGTTTGSTTGVGVSQFLSGTLFGVRATVTADRRYVLMTVMPTHRNEEVVGEFTLPGQIITLPGGGTSVVPGGSIQLVGGRMHQVRTTVMVPDKGTLVLGGQRIADELGVETGVPILSKIPVVKRAFTHRAFVKRERTVLMLIRPQILIPHELEP